MCLWVGRGITMKSKIRIVGELAKSRVCWNKSDFYNEVKKIKPNISNTEIKHILIEEIRFHVVENSSSFFIKSCPKERYLKCPK